MSGSVQQDIRYCTTPDRVRLAYASMGSGEPPIVRTSHWFAHLEHDLESPVFRNFLLDLARSVSIISATSRRINSYGKSWQEKSAYP